MNGPSGNSRPSVPFKRLVDVWNGDRARDDAAVDFGTDRAPRIEDLLELAADAAEFGRRRRDEAPVAAPRRRNRARASARSRARTRALPAAARPMRYRSRTRAASFSNAGLDRPIEIVQPRVQILHFPVARRLDDTRRTPAGCGASSASGRCRSRRSSSPALSFSEGLSGPRTMARPRCRAHPSTRSSSACADLPHPRPRKIRTPRHCRCAPPGAGDRRSPAMRPTTRPSRHASKRSASACAKNGFFFGESTSRSAMRSGGIQCGSRRLRW